MSEVAATPRWMTVDEVAARLRIAESTLRWWTRNGRGPKGVKPGRRFLYRQADVEEYEASLLDVGAEECAG